MLTVQCAQDLAAIYLSGPDKAGQPSFLHSLRVSAAGRTEAEQVLGALHDILEDTDVNPALIRGRFGDEIMQALSAMTREVGEGYQAYLDRVAKNPLARKVKVYDLRDNIMRLGWLKCQDASRAEECDSLLKRYEKALIFLGEVPCTKWK